MLVINMTQHPATAEQKAAGVQDLPDFLRKEVSKIITFEEVPSSEEMMSRAQEVVRLFWQGVGALTPPDRMAGKVGHRAMIGGAPFFMSTLEKVLLAHGIEPVHAFSKRESVERGRPDGSVEKVAVFRHAGFVRI
jgi:hypothetical protein